MKPRERRERGEQDLFRSRLDQIINMDHELVKLAKTISWSFIETKCGEVYTRGPRHAAVADPADGGACDPQAHVRSVR